MQFKHRGLWKYTENLEMHSIIHSDEWREFVDKTKREN